MKGIKKVTKARGPAQGHRANTELGWEEPHLLACVLSTVPLLGSPGLSFSSITFIPGGGDVAS